LSPALEAAPRTTPLLRTPRLLRRLAANTDGLLNCGVTVGSVNLDETGSDRN